MSYQDDGGPAFPCDWVDTQPTTGEQVIRDQSQGMTLRDYLASKALSAVIREMWGNDCYGATPEYAMAGCAYKIADAMLEARKEKQ